MATYRTTNAFHSVTGLPQDDCLTTYHWETDEGAYSAVTAAALNGHVAAAWETVNPPGTSKPSTWISPEISRVIKPTCKTYGISGGSPLAVNDWLAMTASSFDQGMPSEVAMCLSYNADLTGILEEAPDDPDADTRPERPAARRRGRIYVGPLILTCATATEPVRPVSTLMNDLLGLGVGLATISDPTLTAVNARWVVHSDSGFAGANYEITRVSVDDAFDTQRRRGVDRGTRLFASV